MNCNLTGRIFLPMLIVVNGSFLIAEPNAKNTTPKTLAGITVLRLSAGDISVQQMDGFKLGNWTDNNQLWWRNARPGDKLELALDVKKASKKRLGVALTRANDYATIRFLLDGKPIGGTIDAFSTWVGVTRPIPLGTCDLSQGRHVLTVEIVGANKKAEGLKYNVGIDRIVLEDDVKPAGKPGNGSATAIEELFRLELMPSLRPGTQCKMFSSYDRTGGNNDGFGGYYSKLWIENGNNVLAVMDGPGCIQRIWFTHSFYKKDGLLNRKHEHIKIYLDGEKKPALDVPLEDIFSGRLPQFPSPLVGEAQGGFYCYVPIPYRNGCKVVVESTDVRFYQITYREFPTAEGISTFSMNQSPAQIAALESAVKLWSNPGSIEVLGLKNVNITDVDLGLKAGQTVTIDLPAGPHMVRAICLQGKLQELKKAIGSNLQILWDGAEKPAVDMPVEFLFGQALDPPAFGSLLLGAYKNGWYNFMPMPYGKNASITIKAKLDLAAGLRIVTIPVASDLPASKLGYLHVAYSENIPTQPDKHHQFLNSKGNGHYVGTYLATEGQTEKKLPLWLEGDDRFTVDGRMVIHGTGSEDYFNCGWYAVERRLNGPGGSPLHGFPVYRLTGERNYAAAYRWHLSDPVNFEKSIIAEMEHGAHNKLPADYRSAGFYYESKP